MKCTASRCTFKKKYLYLYEKHYLVYYVIIKSNVYNVASRFLERSLKEDKLLKKYFKLTLKLSGEGYCYILALFYSMGFLILSLFSFFSIRSIFTRISTPTRDCAK